MSMQCQHKGSPVHMLNYSGRVGRTFQPDIGSRRDEIEFDPDSLAFGVNEDGETMSKGESENLI